MVTRTGCDGAAGGGSHLQTPRRYAALRRLRIRPTLRANDLPYQEIGAFVLGVRQEQGVVARVLEFMVLTVSRLEEACQAAWCEFDFQARVWTIPAERFKSGKVHHVPLGDAAIAVLEQVRGCDPTWVFPGIGKERGRHLAFKKLLDRLEWPVTALYGARTAFRDWAQARTQYLETRAAVARCLGHKTAGQEAPIANYAHPDRFEDCRALMEDWARWCATVRPAR
ncbi:tyrosine-type recombinase/integrase [Acidovorax sp. SDU_ACID1]|uniref:tyrosine-type recombinase/integrase n=1 Tax=Acidovorax sp. SDU_ACID1 TaxID=3136632 RepID=UPI003872E2AE